MLALSLLIPLEPINSQHDWEYILKRTDFGCHAPALRALQILAGLARVVLYVSFALPSYTFQATHCVLTGFALALHWLRTGFTLGLDYLFHPLWLRSLRTGFALASRWRQRLRTGSQAYVALTSQTSH